MDVICDVVMKHNIPFCFHVPSRPEQTRFQKNDLGAIAKQFDLDEVDATTGFYIQNFHEQEANILFLIVRNGLKVS